MQGVAKRYEPPRSRAKVPDKNRESRGCGSLQFQYRRHVGTETGWPPTPIFVLMTLIC